MSDLPFHVRFSICGCRRAGSVIRRRVTPESPPRLGYRRGLSDPACLAELRRRPRLVLPQSRIDHAYRHRENVKALCALAPVGEHLTPAIGVLLLDHLNLCRRRRHRYRNRIVAETQISLLLSAAAQEARLPRVQAECRRPQLSQVPHELGRCVDTVS